MRDRIGRIRPVQLTKSRHNCRRPNQRALNGFRDWFIKYKSSLLVSWLRPCFSSGSCWSLPTLSHIASTSSSDCTQGKRFSIISKWRYEENSRCTSKTFICLVVHMAWYIHVRRTNTARSKLPSFGREKRLVSKQKSFAEWALLLH